MSIITYSLKKDGDTQLTKNLKVKEFACHDGGDTIKIDSNGPIMLQNIRDHFNQPLKVTSAYRSPSYNGSINGATNSYHTLGQAFDIQVSNTHPVMVAMYAQSIGVKGIGLYAYGNACNDGFVHVDTRENEYFWITFDKTVNYKPIKVFMPELKKGDNGFAVRIMQRKLGLKADGVFGEQTENILNSKYGSKITTEQIWRKMFS